MQGSNAVEILIVKIICVLPNITNEYEAIYFQNRLRIKLGVQKTVKYYLFFLPLILILSKTYNYILFTFDLFLWLLFSLEGSCYTYLIVLPLPLIFTLHIKLIETMTLDKAKVQR